MIESARRREFKGIGAAIGIQRAGERSAVVLLCFAVSILGGTRSELTQEGNGWGDDYKSMECHALAALFGGAGGSSSAGRWTAVALRLRHPRSWGACLGP